MDSAHCYNIAYISVSCVYDCASFLFAQDGVIFVNYACDAEMMTKFCFG